MNVAVPRPIRPLLGAFLCCLLATAPARGAPNSAGRELQTILDEAVAANPALPGVALSVSAPGLRWRGAAGRTQLNGRVPLSADHSFRIASITKVYTAATVFRLMEEGRLDVADEIATYISPGTAAALRGGGYDPHAITIQQLLAHSSGLFDYTAAKGWNAAVLANPRKRWTRGEQIAFAMAHGKPLGAPGERYAYSDTGYVILGEIIERATGQSYALAARGLLNFRTLGLGQTYFETLETAPKAAASRAHQYLGQLDISEIDPSFDLYGGGGVVSTVGDLTAFMRPLFQGTLFRKRGTLAAALVTPNVAHEPEQAPHSYLAVVTPFGKHTCWGHGGFWGSVALYCPDSDIAVALTINQADPRRPGALRSLLARVADVVEKRRTAPRQPAAVGGATSSSTQAAEHR